MMGRMRQTDIRRALAAAAMAAGPRPRPRAGGGCRTKIHHLTLSRENIQIHERANIGVGKRGGGEEKRLEREGRGEDGREREWMYQAEDVRASGPLILCFNRTTHTHSPLLELRKYVHG